MDPQSDTNLPNAQSEYQDGGLWYRAIEASQHRGIKATTFRMVNGAAYQTEYQRIAQCIYTSLDGVQNDEGLDWWNIRADFFGEGGFTGSADIFHPFYSQAEVTSSDPTQRVTYFTRPSTNKALLYVVNPNRADTPTTVTFDTAAMGLPGSTVTAQEAVLETRCVRTAVTGTATIVGQTVTAATGSFTPLNPIQINGGSNVTLTTPIYPNISFDGGITLNNTISSVTDATHLQISTTIIGTNNVTVATLPSSALTLTFDGSTITASNPGAAGSNNAYIVVSGYTVLGTETGFLQITGGTNFLPGFYKITSATAATNRLNLDRPPAYSAASGMAGSTAPVGFVAWIKDGLNSTDCTVGGGSSVHACSWTGTTWVKVDTTTTPIPFSVFGCPGAGVTPTGYQYTPLTITAHSVSLVNPYRQCSVVKLTVTP
jgi:hypothetical protein